MTNPFDPTSSTAAKIRLASLLIGCLISIIVFLICMAYSLYIVCTYGSRGGQSPVLPVANDVPLGDLPPADAVLNAGGEIHERRYLTRRRRTSSGTLETVWSFGSIRRTLSRSIRRRRGSADTLPRYAVPAPPPYEAAESLLAKDTVLPTHPNTQPTHQSSASNTVNPANLGVHTTTDNAPLSRET